MGIRAPPQPVRRLFSAPPSYPRRPNPPFLPGFGLSSSSSSCGVHGWYSASTDPWRWLGASQAPNLHALHLDPIPMVAGSRMRVPCSPIHPRVRPIGETQSSTPASDLVWVHPQLADRRKARPPRGALLPRPCPETVGGSLRIFTGSDRHPLIVASMYQLYCICALSLPNWLFYLSQLLDNLATTGASGLVVSGNNHSVLQVRVFSNSPLQIIQLIWLSTVLLSSLNVNCYAIYSLRSEISVGDIVQTLY
jgi:hypothetical protein